MSVPYRRLSMRDGTKRTTLAVAESILVMAFSMLVLDIMTSDG